MKSSIMCFVLATSAFYVAQAAHHTSLRASLKRDVDPPTDPADQLTWVQRLQKLKAARAEEHDGTKDDAVLADQADPRAIYESDEASPSDDIEENADGDFAMGEGTDSDSGMDVASGKHTEAVASREVRNEAEADADADADDTVPATVVAVAYPSPTTANVAADAAQSFPALQPVAAHAAAQSGHGSRDKRKFLRSCVVVMTARQSGFVPVQQLKKLCAGASAAAECRLTLIDPLRRAHQQGSAAAMLGFCNDAFEWFQGTYGRYCPSACHRTECVTSCAWLKQKKDLDAKSNELIVEADLASRNQQDYEQLREVLTHVSADVASANSSFRRTAMELANSRNRTLERESSYEWHEARVEAANASVHSLAAELYRAKDNATQTESKVVENAKACDTSALHITTLEADQAPADIKGIETKTMQLQHEAEEAEEGADATEHMAEEIQNHEQAVENITHNLSAALKMRQADCDTTVQLLLKAKRNPSRNKLQIATLQDKLLQMTRTRDLAKDALGAREAEAQRIQKTWIRTMKSYMYQEHDAGALVAAADNASASLRVLQNRSVATAAEAAAQQDAAALCRKQGAELLRVSTLAKDALTRAETSLASESRSLAEQEAALQQSVNQRSAAWKELEARSVAVKAAEQLLEASQAKMLTLDRQLEHAKTIWEDSTEALARESQTLSNHVEQLDHSMPKIVRMHGLGFLELFGY